MTDLSSLSVGDLIERQQEIGRRRAEAEAGFKAQQLAVQAEIDRRRVVARFADLSPADRAALADLLEVRR